VNSPPFNFFAAVIVAFVFGVWWARRAGAAGPVGRVARALLPAMLLGTGFAFFETAALAVRWAWSACRLAPTLAFFKGYPLYTPASAGAINGWLYGPVPALLWAPAALASTPIAALAVASLVSLLVMLVPLWLVTRGPGATEAAPGLAAFVFGACALLSIYPTWYMVSVLNGDFAAVGLGVTSCLLLLRAAGPPSRARLATAALLAVLAAWSKQIEVPLALAQLAWLAALHGPRLAVRYAYALVVVGATVSLLFLVSFGPEAVLYNMWTIPSHHAFAGGGRAVLMEVIEFFRYTAVFWLVCVAAAWLVNQTAAGARWRDRLLAQPWWLLVLATLVLLPTGALASIKIGGERNSLHSTYYLIAAATLALASAVARPARLRPALMQAVVLGAAATMLALAVRRVASYPSLSMLPPRCLSTEAFAFAQQHPGETYFPWDPLATVMADGKLYHFEYGVRDRLYAGVTPTPGQIAAHLPPRLRFVIYPRADTPHVMLDRYLPGFTLAADTGDWFVYVRTGQPAPVRP
jgi:hypothetical protein